MAKKRYSVNLPKELVDAVRATGQSPTQLYWQALESYLLDYELREEFKKLNQSLKPEV